MTYQFELDKFTDVKNILFNL